MLEELIDVSAGLGVLLLPLLLLAVPAILLFAVLPAILLAAVAAPLAVIGALIAVPPYLLARRHRRRLRRHGDAHWRIRAATDNVHKTVAHPVP